MDLNLYSNRIIAKILTVTVSRTPLPPSNHLMLLCVTLRACPITKERWGKEKSGGTLILKSNSALSEANDYQIPKAV